jgi:multidrug efflux pump subunit AcrA (membrane-fusion protein)
LQSSLAIANSRVSNDSLQYGRFKKLYEQNAVAQSTYEKWEQQYHNAQNERAAILQQINAQQLSLNLQLQQATNQVRLSVTERNNGNLTCLEDGKVYELYKHTGDHVNPNEAIALIGSHKIIARLSVDEDDYGMIKTGQKVVIKADAFPDKTFNARITKIYPLLNKAEQSFRADAELVEDCPGSLYGLNIEANIIITENQPVLVIPKETLLKGDSVLIKENNKLVKVKITKGIEDKNWVQVKTGLTGKNSIILP